MFCLPVWFSVPKLVFLNVLSTSEAFYLYIGIPLCVVYQCDFPSLIDIPVYFPIGDFSCLCVCLPECMSFREVLGLFIDIPINVVYLYVRLSVSQIIEGDKNWQENLPIDTKREAIWSDGNTRAYKSDSLFFVLTFVVSWQNFCQLLFPYDRCPCIRLLMWLLLTMANSCFVNQSFWLCICQCICSFTFLSTSVWLLIH